MFMAVFFFLSGILTLSETAISNTNQFKGVSKIIQTLFLFHVQVHCLFGLNIHKTYWYTDDMFQHQFQFVV